MGQRSAVIADIVAFIRGVALPFFARFEDPKELISALQFADVPAVGIADAVELALCFADKSSAKKILSRFISERADLADS